jgi:hypothetical protein
MKYFRWGQYLLLCSVFLFSSCLKETLDELSDIKGVKVSNSWRAPLIDASLGMKEIYESYSDKANVSEAPNHLLVFAYHSGDTIAPKQFVNIPDVPFDYVLTMPTPVKIIFQSLGKVEVALDELLTLPASNNEKIKRINVKQGTFTIDINNTFQHDAKIIVYYPTIVSPTGQPLTDTIDVTRNTDLLPRIVDLAGYTIDFTNGNITSNTLPLHYEISVVNNGNPVDELQDALSVSQNFHLESYNNIVGYLGRFEVFNASESQQVDLFDKQTAGKIFVNDPKIVIRVYNTFGVPVTGQINNLRVTTAGGVDLPISVDPFKDTFSFKKPDVPGQIAISEYTIDKHNSNIDDAINSAPSFVKFDMGFIANYNEVENEDNFLIDTASFITSTNVEIPLDLKIVDYVALQQERPKESDTSGLKYVTHAQLSIRTENTLPFDLFAQMIFTRDTVINGIDSSYVTDSLFVPELPVIGAVVDANGEVIAPTVSYSTVSLDIARYERIQRSQNYLLRIRAQSSTFGGSQAFVKIYSTQKLNMKIGADVKLTYKSND